MHHRLPFANSETPSAAYEPFSWPEYHLPLIYPKALASKSVGKEPTGAHYRLWPLNIEDYRGDKEPLLTEARERRGIGTLAVWHQLARSDTPKGWWRPPGRSALYLGCFDGLTSHFLSQWSSKTRYYVNHFRAHQESRAYTVEHIQVDEFVAAYHQSTVAKEINELELHKLLWRVAHFPAAQLLLGVRRISDGKVIAGLTAFTSKEAKASHYGCGFYLPEVAKDHLMVVLMERWFALSAQAGVQVLHLGLFLPETARGPKRSITISTFKKQFVTHLYSYQPPLMRFIPGRLL